MSPPRICSNIASAPAAPETPATPSSSTTAMVTASALNVRTGPGTNYAVITTIARGTQVTVTEKGASWSLISVNNRTGYVSNEYHRVCRNAHTAVSARTARRARAAVSA